MLRMMANDEEAVGKALMASSSTAITFQDSVNSNLIIIVDSGVSGHYFHVAILRDLKHRLQDYVHLVTRRKILTVRRTLLDGKAKGLLQGLVTDDCGNQIFV